MNTHSCNSLWSVAHISSHEISLAEMDPQMMEAARKMMSKVSREDMDRMTQVCCHLVLLALGARAAAR